MLRGLRHVFGLIVAASTCAWAQADLGHLKLVGVLVAAGKQHVILVDSVTGRSSGWIQVGQAFGDNVITGYNAGTDTVVVSCHGATRSIPLVDAKTLSGVESIQVGTSSYTVFADAREPRTGGAVFRGHVTVLGDGLRISADEARWDPGRLSFQGKVRVERAGVLLEGSAAVVQPDARTLVMSGATLQLRGANPPAQSSRAPQP